MRSLIKPPLAGSVEAASVHGAQVYRSIVSGFASSAQAHAFCAALTAQGKPCWLHLASATAGPTITRPMTAARRRAPAHAAVSASDFWFLGVTANNTVYVYADPKTLATDSAGRKAVWFTWVLEGAKIAQANAKREDFRLVFDCASRKSKMSNLVVYDVQGSIVSSGETPEGNWSAAEPNSVSAMEQAFACSAPSAWAKRYIQVLADPVPNADSLYNRALALQTTAPAPTAAGVPAAPPPTAASR
jgi:hypothetical protein